MKKSNKSDISKESKTTKAGNEKLEKTQQQVDEVLNIMRDNVERIIERGEKIEDLTKIAVQIQTDSEIFSNHGEKIKNKYLFQNVRIWILVIVTGVILLGIAAGLIYSALR